MSSPLDTRRRAGGPETRPLGRAPTAVARWLAAALAVAAAWPAAAGPVVYLDYGFDFPSPFVAGNAVELSGTGMVARLQQLEPDRTRQQIASEIKSGVKARLEQVFAGLDITFKEGFPASGFRADVDKAVFVVGGQRAVQRSAYGLGLRGGNRSWVFVDSFESGPVFIPPPPGDGHLRRLEMHHPDTAPQNEVVNALAKTVAHELGHNFDLPDLNKTNQLIEPESGWGNPPGSDLPAGTQFTVDPVHGVMVQGLNILADLEYLAPDQAFLTKSIGKVGEAAKPKQTSRVGDADYHGTALADVGFDTPEAMGPRLADVTREADDAPGTDTLLSMGSYRYTLDFDQPVASTLDSAFLSLGLFNAAPGAIGGLHLAVDGRSFDLGSWTAGLDAGGLVSSLLLDLDDVDGLLAALAGARDIVLTLDVAASAAHPLSVDFVRLDVFGVPEPGTASLLAMAALGLALASRRTRRQAPR